MLIVLLGVLLVAAGVEDARNRQIANWKNAAIALLAPLWWLGQPLPLPDMLIQLAIAGAVLGLFCIPFALGWMGGGDVKMIAALALWLPLASLANMLIAMSLIGGVLTLILLASHAMRRDRGAVEIPYGVAIAIAAILVLPQTSF